MATNLVPAFGRVPAFKNILTIKSTLRTPVIPYFTRQQWKMAIKGLPRRPLSQPDPSIPRLHYQPAPWGRGDIIVVFKELILDDPGSLCTPRVKVKRDRDGAIQIVMVLDCPPPQTKYGCKAYFVAFPDHIDYRIDPVRCLDEDCKGFCSLVLEGAETLGDIYCTCNRVT